MVSLYDGFISNLGFTDNSGVIMFADFTLPPGGYWFQAGAAGYMINRVSYTVLSEAPINDEKVKKLFHSISSFACWFR